MNYQFKNGFNKLNGIHLNYAYFFDRSRSTKPTWINDPIESILNKHDKMIREYIDREIGHNPKDIKSADYIFNRNGVVKMYDLKTITGQASIGNRLNDSIGQSNRVFLNLATSYKANLMAIEIKNYFESNKEALEVLISVGKKLISVERIFTQKKDYYKQFRKMVENKKSHPKMTSEVLR